MAAGSGDGAGGLGRKVPSWMLQLKYGDRIGLQWARGGGGLAFVSGGGLIDSRVRVEELDQVAKKPPNGEDCIFEVRVKQNVTAGNALKAFLADETVAKSRKSDAGGDGSVTGGTSVTGGARESQQKMYEERVAREEAGNAKNNERVQGHSVVYGATIQLLHRASGKFLCVMKTPADVEPRNLRVALAETPGDDCWFRVHTAYANIKSNGEPVQYRDTVSLGSVKFPGNYLELHKDEAQTAERPKSHPYVRGVYEVSAGLDAALLHAVPYALPEVNLPEEARVMNNRVRNGDMVVVYARTSERVLSMGADGVPFWQPASMSSIRGNTSAEFAMASWMLENEKLEWGGVGTTYHGDEGGLQVPPVMLRHVGTGLVLAAREGGKLEGTHAYDGEEHGGTAPAVGFLLAPQAKANDALPTYGQLIHLLRMGDAGEKLAVGQASTREEELAGGGGSLRPGMRAACLHPLSIEDSLELFHISGAAAESVRKMRNLVRSLRRFATELADGVGSISGGENLNARRPPPGDGAAMAAWWDEIGAQVDGSGLWDVLERNLCLNSSTFAVSDVRRQNLRGSMGLQGVFWLIVQLLVEQGKGNVLTWSGFPNTNQQELFREFGGIDVIFDIFDTLFMRKEAKGAQGASGGIPPFFVDCPRAEVRGLLLTCRQMHRVLQLCVDGNVLNKTYIGANEGMMEQLQHQLGTEMRSANTILALMQGNADLLGRLRSSFLYRMTNMLAANPMPRFVAFLNVATNVDGSPIPRNQNRIVDMLLSSRDANDAAFTGEQYPADPREFDIAEIPGQDTSEDRDAETIHIGIGASALLTVSVVEKPLLGILTEDPASGEWVESGPERFERERTLVITSSQHGLSFDVRHFMGKADKLLETDTADNNKMELVFRFYVSTLELLRNLCIGRNRHAIDVILRKSERIGVTFEILDLLVKHERVPYAVRHRALDLIVTLYVDRDPLQAFYPVNLVLVREEADPKNFDVERWNLDPWATMGQRKPPDMTFSELRGNLVKYLQTRLTVENGFDLKLVGQNRMTTSVMRSLLTLLRLGFFWKQSNGIILKDKTGRGSPDWSAVETVVNLVVPLLDGRTDLIIGAKTRGLSNRFSWRSSEAMIVMECKTLMCEVLGFCFDMRVNYRLQVSFQTFSSTYQEPQYLAPPVETLEGCRGQLFGVPIIGPMVGFSPTIPRDALPPFIEIMLDCLRYEYPPLRQKAAELLERHLAQPAALVRVLDRSLVLDTSSDVRIYYQCLSWKSELDGRWKFFGSTNQEERQLAVQRSMKIFTTFRAMCTVGGPPIPELDPLMGGNAQAPRDFGNAMQRCLILKNIGVFESALAILKLPLVRTKVSTEAAAMDQPVDPARRDLFHVVYQFLAAFCVVGETPMKDTQQLIFANANLFFSHMGTEKLNVADALSASILNNRETAVLVTLRHLEKFVDLIRTYGKTPRWLRFLERAIVVEGKPNVDNQIMVMDLLLKDVEAVLTLATGAEARKWRAEQLALEEQNWRHSDFPSPDAYLAQTLGNQLLHHLMSIRLLAGCCKGPVTNNKVKCSALLPLDVVISNIVDVDVEAAPKLLLDPLMVMVVKKVYIDFLTHVYMDGDHDQALYEVQDPTNKIWHSDHGRSLMDVVIADMEAAVTAHDQVSPAASPLLDYVYGKILPLLQVYMSKHFERNVLVHVPNARGKLQKVIGLLHWLLLHTHRVTDQSCILEILERMRRKDIPGTSPMGESSGNSLAVNKSMDQDSVELTSPFVAGFRTFFTALAQQMGISDVKRPRGKGARNLAYMFARADATGKSEVIPGSMPPVTFESVLQYLIHHFTNSDVAQGNPTLLATYAGVFHSLLFVDDPRKVDTDPEDFSDFDAYLGRRKSRAMPKAFTARGPKHPEYLGMEREVLRAKHNDDLISWAQRKYMRLGLGNFAMKMVSSPNNAVYIEAIALLGTLAGGPVFISMPNYDIIAGEFFGTIHSRLIEGVQMIKAMENRLQLNKGAGKGLDVGSKDAEAEADIDFMLDVIEMLSTLQKLCAGGNVQLQELMVAQPRCSRTYNLVADIVILVEDCIPMLNIVSAAAVNGALCERDFVFMDLLTMALKTANETYAAPCRLVQNEVTMRTPFLKLMGTLLSILKYEDPKDRDEVAGEFSTTSDTFMGVRTKDYTWNDVVVRIRASASRAILGLFEGLPAEDTYRGRELVQATDVGSVVIAYGESLTLMAMMGAASSGKTTATALELSEAFARDDPTWAPPPSGRVKRGGDALLYEVSQHYFLLEALRNMDKRVGKGAVSAYLTKAGFDDPNVVHSRAHTHRPSPREIFQDRFTETVEVLWNGRIFQERFTLTKVTQSLKSDTEWSRASAQEILETILATDDGDGDNRAEIVEEMKQRLFGMDHVHDCMSGSSRAVRWVVLRSVTISRLGFFSSLLIMVLLLIGYGRNNEEFGKSPVSPVVAVTGFLQLFCVLSTLGLFCYINIPILLERQKFDADALIAKQLAQDSRHRPAVRDFSVFDSAKEVAPVDALDMNDMTSPKQDLPYPSQSFKEKVASMSAVSIFGILYIAEFWYLLLLAVCSVMGLLSTLSSVIGLSSARVLTPFWYCVQVVDVFRFPAMRALGSAVYVGGPELVGTVVVAILIIFFFAIFSFLVFSEGLDEGEVPTETCGTFYKCVMMHLVGGFYSGDDHGADLSGAIVPTGLTTGFNTLQDHIWDKPALQTRSAYIKLFAWTYGFLLSALFGAQVVDAYSEIRSREQYIVDTLAARCPMCGLSNDALETRHPSGFFRHAHEEHAIKNYLFYLHYLRSTPEAQHTGLEAYVWRCLKVGDLTWLPRLNCFALQEIDLSRENQGTGEGSAISSDIPSLAEIGQDLALVRAELKATLLKARPDT